MNMVLHIRKSASYFHKKLAYFVRNSQAVAAVEFALIAPILLILFIGTVEISLVVSVDRKISRTSSAIADLIGQSSDFTGTDGAAELRAILGATDRIMYPYTNRIPCVVISILEAKAETDTNGDGKTDNDDDVIARVTGSIDNKTSSSEYTSPANGQCNKDSNALTGDELARQVRTIGSEFDLPDAINVHGSTLIVAEVEYDHQPIIGFVNSTGPADVTFNKAAITLGDRIFLRPRQGGVEF